MNVTHEKQRPALREVLHPVTGNYSEPLCLAGFFFKWDKLLQHPLETVTYEDRIFIPAELPAATSAFEQDTEQLQAGLIEGFLGAVSKEEKNHIVHSSQSLIGHLLNKLYHCSRSTHTTEPLQAFYAALSRQLEATLEHLERLYGPYFNKSESVPLCLIPKSLEHLRTGFEKLSFLTVEPEGMDETINGLLLRNLNAFYLEENNSLSFRDLSYYKSLLEELSILSEAPSALTLRETLYYLNYNDKTFVRFERNRLLDILNRTDNLKCKIALLRQEQKSINQLSIRLNHCYNDSLPPVDVQMNQWINEEIKYLESGSSLVIPEGDTNVYTDKIHTSLSVAKLALLIRLLVIDKIIINRTVAPMLRIVARLFTTLQRDDISFGSLETKYHAPEKATITAVRDMLFKWINILGKL